MNIFSIGKKKFIASSNVAGFPYIYFLNKISNKELIEKGFSASGYNWKCSQRIYVLQFSGFFLDEMLLLIYLMLKVMIEYIINKDDIDLRGLDVQGKLTLVLCIFCCCFFFFWVSKMIKERQFNIRIDYFDNIVQC